MKKVLKITGISLLVVVLLAAIFLGVWFLWPWNGEFFKTGTKAFAIPGLETAIAPQGLTKIDGQEKYIVSGYMSDGSASRFYVVDKTSGDVEKYFTLTLAGADYTGHACGVTSYEDNLWTCSNDGFGGTVYRFSLSDVENVENGESVEIIDSFKSNNGADFVTVDNNILWVGEFYRKGNYETHETHHIKTRSGETNTAVAFGFEIDGASIGGVKDTVADKALSLPNQVQGMAISENGEVIISISYSLPDSKISIYKDVLSEEKHSTITVEGNEVELWFLDGESLLKENNAPAMTEEIIVEDGKVLILNESACKKYKLFTRKKVRDVYSFDIEDLK